MLPLSFSNCVVLGTFRTFRVTQHIEGRKVLTPLGCWEELIMSWCRTSHIPSYRPRPSKAGIAWCGLVPRTRHCAGPWHSVLVRRALETKGPNTGPRVLLALLAK